MNATFKIVPQGCFKQLLVTYTDHFQEVVCFFKIDVHYIYILNFCTNDMPLPFIVYQRKYFRFETIGFHH